MTSFIALDRQGEKSVQKILDNIEKSKSSSMSRFIYALGIRHVGEQTAKLIAKKFGDLESILNATHDQLMEIDGIGPAVAETFADEFGKKNFANEVKAMIKLGVHPEEEKAVNASNKFAGLTFVITGTLPMERDKVKAIIEENGGKASGSVSKKTSYVLAGEEAGSKLDKARELNVKILEWNDFQKLLK